MLKENKTLLKYLFCLAGLCLLTKALHLMMLPSEHPNILGLYSSKKFVAIIGMLLIGSFLYFRVSLKSPSSVKDLSILFFTIIFSFHLVYILLVPANIWADFSAQASSLIDFNLSRVDNLNTLAHPDYNDLSNNVEGYIFFYPPGSLYLLYPFIKIGLSLGNTLKLIGSLSFLFGGIAWLKILKKFGLNSLSLNICGILFGFHCIDRFGLNVISYSTSDLFCFGIVSWLIYFCLQFHDSVMLKQSSWKIVCVSALLGLGLGLIYCFKYSQFIYAASLAPFITLSCLYLRNKIKILVAFLVIAVCFFTPYFWLNSIQEKRSGISAVQYQETEELNDAEYIQQKYGDYFYQSSRGLPLLASIPVGTVWNTLGNGFPVRLANLLVYPSAVREFFNDYKVNALVVISIALSWVILTLCLWLLWDQFRKLPYKLFFALLLLIPTALHTYLSHKIGYNYLVSHEFRFGIPILFLVEGILIHALLKKQNQLGLKVFILFIFAFPLYGAFQYNKSYFWESNWIQNQANSSHLYSNVLNPLEIDNIRKMSRQDDDLYVFLQQPNDGNIFYTAHSMRHLLEKRVIMMDLESMNDTSEPYKTSKLITVHFLVPKQINLSIQNIKEILDKKFLHTSNISHHDDMSLDNFHAISFDLNP